MDLDARTLLFAVAMLALLISLMSWLLSSSSGDRDYGFKQWSMASASAGISVVLIFFRSHIPEIYGIFLANVILLFSASACLWTVSKFYETAFPMRNCMAMVAIGLLGLLMWLWGNFSLSVPTVTVCLALSVILFNAAWLAMKKAARPYSFSVLLLVSTLGIMASMYCLRALDTALTVRPPSGDINNSASQLGVLIVGALFIVSASIGFFVMVHEHQRTLIEELSRRDVLTGVLTRRAFFSDANRITHTNANYAVLMMDIDHFKSINDRFGHVGGDKVLAHFARVLMKATRIDDVLGRYGGEEFCAILPNCGLADAEKIAQGIVQQIREQHVNLAEAQFVSFTLSIGVAVPHDANGLLNTIQQADEALYAAKHAGRDRVSVSRNVCNS
jgi:diguanylate cyclase (GGDEF)-like protein